MDAELVGGFRYAAVTTSEDPADEPFLELMDGVFELDALFDHFLDEPLKSIANYGPCLPAVLTGVPGQSGGERPRRTFRASSPRPRREEKGLAVACSTRSVPGSRER